MKYVDYKPPKLVKGKRWYVEFYYRVPDELKPLYKNRDWERWRVFEDINRYKNDEYADLLLKSVAEALRKGYNPFAEEEMDFAFDFGGDKELTLLEAINTFKLKYKEKGLDEDTVYRYNSVADVVISWFTSKKIEKQPVDKIRRKHIETMLAELKAERKWGNRQYNNYKGYVSTIFSFLKKADIVKENPAEGIDKLKQSSKKHRYYDAKIFKKICEVLQTNDPYLWIAAQFVYYLGVRSGKELRLLKIEDIQDDLFRFRMEISKSDREDYVPIDPHLREVIDAMNLPADGSLYIFGAQKKPASKPVGEDYFSKRFAAIRKLAGLDKEHTLYSFKHTRATHLIKDGVKLADISRLFRHTDIGTTAKYIRDLGVDFDAKDMLSKSRKI